MRHLEVSCAVRPIQWPLGVKWLISQSVSRTVSLPVSQPASRTVSLAANCFLLTYSCHTLLNPKHTCTQDLLQYLPLDAANSSYIQYTTGNI